MIRPFDWWRTVFYLIPAVTLYTIVLGTISLLSTLFDRSGNFAHQCARAWARLILATTGVRVQVSGLQHLEPGRSYVFAANHQSIYDIPIVFTAIPSQLRIVAKESLGRIPFMGWHLHRAGHLLVDRRNPGADIVEKMARLVRQGHSLIVFPEGTRSVDGVVGRFKKGSFAVAVDARLPVVPVTITGSRQVMKKGQLMVCPGEVQLVVHPPIATEGITRDRVLALADRVRTAVLSS
ncbi:MAG: lysophospholipid acyltransferase family protein [Vicinamibacterales bacterium]